MADGQVVDHMPYLTPVKVCSSNSINLRFLIVLIYYPKEKHPLDGAEELFDSNEE